jgi:hypothetical protein
LVPPAKEESSLLEEETVIKEHTRKKKATHEDLFKGQKIVIFFQKKSRFVRYAVRRWS